MDLIKVVNEAFATKKEFPAFKSGDTITVAYRIKEGNKERIQQYRGVVIRISGHGEDVYKRQVRRSAPCHTFELKFIFTSFCEL